VLVGFLATDVGFIHLDDALQLEFAGCAGFTNAVQHVPGCAVLDTQFLGQLHGGNTLAGRHDAVNGHNPVLQGCLGAVQDRVGLDIEILAAGSAPVCVLALGLWADPVGATAASADRFAIPPDPFQPCNAGIIIRESPQQLGDADGFGVSIGFWHCLSPLLAYLYM